MKPLSPVQLKEFLDEKVRQFNTTSFIADDPISIPHQFHLKEDREIAGFLTALIAWGQRKVILKNAHEMMRRMDEQPYDFIYHHTSKERKSFSDFVHRTFNGVDAMYLLKALQSKVDFPGASGAQVSGQGYLFFGAYEFSKKYFLAIEMSKYILSITGASSYSNSDQRLALGIYYPLGEK